MSDISDVISSLQKNVGKLSPNATEEATKHSLILPFITEVLGYDAYDPDEVIPEFTADRGIKNGEKVDYAICQNGEPHILIECKPVHANLDCADSSSQIFRYFTCLKHVHIAVLTNGIEYRFFSDIDDPNLMDSKPFMIFDVMNPDKSLYREIERLSKSRFDMDVIMRSAKRLKYERSVMSLINQQFSLPDEAFIKYVMGEVYKGNKSKTKVEWFKSIVRDAMSKVILTRVDERLASALKANASMQQENMIEILVNDEQSTVTNNSALEIYHKDFTSILDAGLISTDEVIYIRKSEINSKKLAPQPLGTFKASWEAQLFDDGKLRYGGIPYKTPSTLVRTLTNQQSAAGYRYLFIERGDKQIPVEYLRRIKSSD